MHEFVKKGEIIIMNIQNELRLCPYCVPAVLNVLSDGGRCRGFGGGHTYGVIKDR